MAPKFQGFGLGGYHKNQAESQKVLDSRVQVSSILFGGTIGPNRE